MKAGDLVLGIRNNRRIVVTARRVHKYYLYWDGRPDLVIGDDVDSGNWWTTRFTPLIEVPEK